MNATMQVLVGLNKAYAAKVGGGTIAGFHEIHLLDVGAIAIFDEENNLILTTTLAAAVATVQKFYVVQGMPTGFYPRISVPIDRNAFHQKFTAYQAPVLQVSKAGKVATAGQTGFPVTFVTGTKATVIVTDTTIGWYQANQSKRYEVGVFS